jgi:hypothetical protein
LDWVSSMGMRMELAWAKRQNRRKNTINVLRMVNKPLILPINLPILLLIFMGWWIILGFF